MHSVKIIYYLLIFTLSNGIICSIVLYHFCVFTLRERYSISFSYHIYIGLFQKG